ncbi:hypothetical protein RND61_23825 [Streptomyces sp. TRM76323]|uniref:Uncharacterized protein n=1 Tax=Streptomyces tamarix TaxID=3078565 RepID=A0ABU3QQM8_9ACTN|nr:hypothetical protein [Streptomyces tamarix]MDT9685064.1 hypothetical protein [Streptomyces tamarix]
MGSDETDAQLFRRKAQVAGCAGPSPSGEDYRRKAANTAQTAASAVSTARLAVEAAGKGRLTGPYVSVLLGEAETDLLAAQGTFESRQPPGEEADAVRERLGELLDDAADVLADVRIGARRGAVPVAVLGALGPADQSVRVEVAQRPADVVGALLVRQQQRLELAGRGQAQPGQGEQGFAAKVRAGLRHRRLAGPERLSRNIRSRRRGVATRRSGRVRSLISDNRRTAAGGRGARCGACCRGGI